MSIEELFASILTRWRDQLPVGVSHAYFDGFVRRRRAELLKILGEIVASRPRQRSALTWTREGGKTGPQRGDAQTGLYLVRRDPKRARYLVEWRPRGGGEDLLLGTTRRPIDGRRLADEHLRAREDAKAGLEPVAAPLRLPLALGAWLAQRAALDDASLALRRSDLRERLAELGLRADDMTITTVARGYTDEARRLVPREAENVFRARADDDDDRVVVRPRVVCGRCGVELAEPAAHVALWADGRPVVCPGGADECSPIDEGAEG